MKNAFDEGTGPKQFISIRRTANYRAFGFVDPGVRIMRNRNKHSICRHDGAEIFRSRRPEVSSRVQVIGFIAIRQTDAPTNSRF